VTIQRKQSTRSGRGLLFGYFRGEGGNFAAVMALLLVPLVGALSMALEASNWFLISRATQNAADSAAIAATNNGSATLVGTGSYPQFAWEGWANTKQYGFTNGSNNVTVDVRGPTATANTLASQTCPDGTSTCYQVTVTKVVPIYLTAVLGFRGDTTIGTQPAKTISSTALAEPINPIFAPSCLTAVGSDGSIKNDDAIEAKGTPDADNPNCTISAVGPSPSSIDCNSHSLGAYYGFAVGTIASKCGFTEGLAGQSSSKFCNPYATGQPTGCPASSYPANISTAVSGTTGACSTLTGSTLGAQGSSCLYSGADLTLGFDLNPSSPITIVINNGNLNMNGHSSNNVTFIFDGSSPGTFDPVSINIIAPSTGSLSGIAAFQTSTSTSPKIATWTDNGNDTIKTVGLIYMPYTNTTFGGNITWTSPAVTGVTKGACAISVFNAIEVNGTGYALDKSGCGAAGLTGLPTTLMLRAALVQ
jgi:Flp pilus assembly protein TadG